MVSLGGVWQFAHNALCAKTPFSFLPSNFWQTCNKPQNHLHSWDKRQMTLHYLLQLLWRNTVGHIWEILHYLLQPPMQPGQKYINNNTVALIRFMYILGDIWWKWVWQKFIDWKVQQFQYMCMHLCNVQYCSGILDHLPPTDTVVH